MIALVSFFALLIGVSLGLLGGGGSIVAVPVLVHIAGLPSKEAIAMSLLVVGATSIVGVVHHAMRGNVDWHAGAVFAPFAMAGAFAGGLGAAYVPGSLLLGMFAAMMVATSVAMLRGRESSDAEGTRQRVALWKIALEGLAIGGFTGLVGAGGGFLVVPTLMLLGGLSMRAAVGTSLLVIAAKSFTGFAGYASHVQLDYPLALTLVGFAVVGTLLGSSLSTRVAADKLRSAFAYFVLMMGVAMLLEPLGWSIATIITCIIAVVVTAASLQRWHYVQTSVAPQGVVS